MAIALSFENGYLLKIMCCWHVISFYRCKTGDFEFDPYRRTLVTCFDPLEQTTKLSALLVGKQLKSFLDCFHFTSDSPAVTYKDNFPEDGSFNINFDEFENGRNIEENPFSEFPHLMMTLAPLKSKSGVNWILQSPTGTQLISKQVLGESILMVEM